MITKNKYFYSKYTAAEQCSSAGVIQGARRTFSWIKQGVSNLIDKSEAYFVSFSISWDYPPFNCHKQRMSNGTQTSDKTKTGPPAQHQLLKSRENMFRGYVFRPFRSAVSYKPREKCFCGRRFSSNRRKNKDRNNLFFKLNEEHFIFHLEYKHSGTFANT